MPAMRDPVIVGFPLRGEWLSPNTPGTKIPSHGTNRLGTRYAYDFIQVDWSRTGNPAYRVHFMQYLLRGARLSDYFCWGQEIYAPCDGIVIAAEDGYIENQKTNLFADIGDTIRILCGPERAGTARCCVALAPHMSYMRRSRALQRTAPAHSGLYDLPCNGNDGFLRRTTEPYRTYGDGARREKLRSHLAGGALYPDCIA